MNNSIDVQNLCKNYKDFQLKDVAFSVPTGFVTGFIGDNGAGKTTTIKSILQMIHYDSGSIHVFGEDLTKSPRLKEDIGVVMDLPFYVSDWTAKDIVRGVSPFYTQWDNDRFYQLLHDLQVSPTKKVKELSHGNKMKLMLAIALSHHAKLLILDEPTSGLDPAVKDELLQILQEFMTNEQHSIFISTHMTADLERIADYITYVQQGMIVFTGLEEELINSFRLVKGGLGDLGDHLRPHLIGLSTHSSGFDAMVKTEDASALPSSLLVEPVSLEELMIYQSKECKQHEFH